MLLGIATIMHDINAPGGLLHIAQESLSLQTTGNLSMGSTTPPTMSRNTSSAQLGSMSSGSGEAASERERMMQVPLISRHVNVVVLLRQWRKYCCVARMGFFDLAGGFDYHYGTSLLTCSNSLSFILNCSWKYLRSRSSCWKRER